MPLRARSSVGGPAAAVHVSVTVTPFTVEDRLVGAPAAPPQPPMENWTSFEGALTPAGVIETDAQRSTHRWAHRW